MDKQKIQQEYKNRHGNETELEITLRLLSKNNSPEAIYNAYPDSLLDLIRLGRPVGELYQIKLDSDQNITKEEFHDDLINLYHTAREQYKEDVTMGKFPTTNTKIDYLIEHGWHPEDIEAIQNHKNIPDYKEFSKTLYVTDKHIDAYNRSAKHHVSNKKGAVTLNSFYQHNRDLVKYIVEHYPEIRAKVDATEMRANGFSGKDLQEMKISRVKRAYSLVMHNVINPLRGKNNAQVAHTTETLAPPTSPRNSTSSAQLAGNNEQQANITTKQGPTSGKPETPRKSF